MIADRPTFELRAAALNITDMNEMSDLLEQMARVKLNGFVDMALQAPLGSHGRSRLYRALALAGQNGIEYIAPVDGVFRISLLIAPFHQIPYTGATRSHHTNMQRTPEIFQKYMTAAPDEYCITFFAHFIDN